MMRYRRNRASTMEGGAQNHPSSSNPAGSQMPQQQQQQQQLLPSSIGYGAGASANGAPWTAMYQGSAGMKASGTASGVGGGAGSSGLLGAAAAGGRGGGNGGGGPPSNWGISYGSNAVTASDGRPKSANFNAGQPTAAASNSLMASLTGAGRPSSSVQPSQVPLSTNWSSQQQQQSQSGQQQLSINNNSNTLSYGSLKNRFLSGTGGKSNMPSQSSNNNVGASAAAGAGAGNKSSSKLFSLAR